MKYSAALRQTFISLAIIAAACQGDPEEMDKIGRSVWKSIEREMSQPVDPTPAKPDLDRIDKKGVSFTWLGHASVLIDIHGTRVLIDPVLSERVLIFRRTVAAPVAPEKLTDVDLILLTDANYDHIDRKTLKLVPKGAEVITPPRTRDRVADLMFRRVRVLDWGESIEFDKLRIRSIEAGEGGRSSPLDPAADRKCSAYLLASGDYKVLYAAVPADTAALQKAVEAMEKVDLAVLPIGPAGPPWPDEGTFRPETAARLAKKIDAAEIIPIHYGTFLFGEEDADSLFKRFEAEADSLGIADRIVRIKIGETLLLN